MARMSAETLIQIRAWKLALADFLYGLNPNLTAATLSIPVSAANKARNHPAYQERIQELKEDMNRRLERELGADAEKMRVALSARVPEAMEVLAEALRSKDPNIRIRAAQEILDRDGRLPKVSRVQNEQKDARVLPQFDAQLLDEFHQDPAKMN